MLTCENLACVRGGRMLFERLEFTINPGSALILRGPNGCGKTTLLKLLAGLISPSEGQISWQGTSIKEDPLKYHQNIAFLGHKNAIKLQQTVLENLNFWAKAWNTEKNIKKALKHFDLTPLQDLPCYQLSQGWQRRVALARVMLSPAKCWLLDEPLSNLDEEAAEMVLSMVAKHCEKGGIAILSSHQELEVASSTEIHITEYIQVGAVAV